MVIPATAGTIAPSDITLPPTNQIDLTRLLTDAHRAAQTPDATDRKAERGQTHG